MLNELSNDPIQAAISRLEKQHEEDKQGNLLFALHIWSCLQFNKFPFSCPGKTAPRIRKTISTIEKHNVTFYPIFTVRVRSLAVW